MIPAGNYMFKVNNKYQNKVLNISPCSNVSIGNFEQVNADWEYGKFS